MRKLLNVAAITAISLVLFTNGQITEQKFIAKENLVKSLNTPKICPQLRKIFLESFKNGKQELSNIMIEFKGGNFKALKDFKDASDSGVVKATTTRGEKITNLVERLEDNAALSQKEVIDFLKLRKYHFRAFWVANEIFVKSADAKLFAEIAKNFPSVERIRAVGINRNLNTLKSPKKSKKPTFLVKNDSPNPWQIDQVKARCNDIKCLGEGVVVAIIDNGIFLAHIELKDNFRQDYGFYDPVTGSEFPAVTEDNHGTSVAAVAVGKTTGVAPKAQWISCLISGVGETSDGEEVYGKACGEFMLCPFRWNNTQDRDCSKAPDIINISWEANIYVQWAIPTDFFYSTVAAWNTAGIISVFQAGDDGPFCNTVNPPASYDISFSVGSLDNNHNIAYELMA